MAREVVVVSRDPEGEEKVYFFVKLRLKKAGKNVNWVQKLHIAMSWCRCD